MGKKIISFSLYGTKQMYQDGAIENSILVKKYYPKWECRFYVSNEISEDTIKILEDNGSYVVRKKREDIIDGMFWRFLPIDEEDVEIMIVRDSDSRILKREVEAVNQWLESDKKFHIMRDNPAHIILIPGGMFGMKKGVIKNKISDLLEEWKNERKKLNLGWANEYGLDQLFLAQKIYPKIKNNVLIHSELIRFQGEKVKPFPIKRINNEFVGEAIDTEDNKIDYEIDFSKLKMKTYPHPLFYYDRKFIYILNLIRKFKNYIKGKE